MKIRIKQELAAVEPSSQVLDKAYLDSIWGEINRYNIKSMGDGKQYVVHCLTGWILERKDAQPIKDKRGNIFWIGIKEKISPLDRPVMNPWKNPERGL